MCLCVLTSNSFSFLQPPWKTIAGIKTVSYWLCSFSSGSCVVPVFVWRCQQACPGRAAGAPADASSTPMIGVTSVGTEATTPMTATASASEAAAAAGEGTQSCLAHRYDWYNALFQNCPSKGPKGINLFVFPLQVSLSLSFSLKVQIPRAPLPLSLPQP